MCGPPDGLEETCAPQEMPPAGGGGNGRQPVLGGPAKRVRAEAGVEPALAGGPAAKRARVGGRPEAGGRGGRARALAEMSGAPAGEAEAAAADQQQQRREQQQDPPRGPLWRMLTLPAKARAGAGQHHAGAAAPPPPADEGLVVPGTPPSQELVVPDSPALGAAVAEAVEPPSPPPPRREPVSGGAAAEEEGPAEGALREVAGPQQAAAEGPRTLRSRRRPARAPALNVAQPGSNWTVEEDTALREAVQTHGTVSWKKVANMVPTRTNKQCRKRWQQHLRTGVVKGSWTSEEDAAIFAGVAQHGHKWAKISRQLPGRSDNSIKNRYHSVVKRREQEASYLGAAAVVAAPARPASPPTEAPAVLAAPTPEPLVAPSTPPTVVQGLPTSPSKPAAVEGAMDLLIAVALQELSGL